MKPKHATRKVAASLVSSAGALAIVSAALGWGLVGEGAQLWHAADLAGGLGPPSAEFGYAVATGDFDGDLRLDVAIGDPFAAIGASADAGAVYVAYGSAAGIDATGSEVWTQNTGTLQNSSESGDLFGFSLAVGDFNGDFKDDLAIGIPGETINGKSGAGAFAILFGSSTGLTDTDNHFWHEDRNGIVGVASAGDAYGHALAAGEFDDDDYADLAIGIPGQDGQGYSNSGGVQVFYGSSVGPTSAREENWEQGFNLLNTTEAGDNFGRALTTGDFNNDGWDDLVIGVPFEDLPPQPGGNGTDVGAIHVVLGAAGGLTVVGNRFWHQREGSTLGGHDGSEHFGSALAAGDFDDDDHDDLAIGAPGEPMASGADAGWINVLFGDASGLTDSDNQAFSQGFAGLLGTEGNGHRFGAALTTGDFDGDGVADLAVAASGDNVAGAAAAGSVTLIYGTTASGLDTAGNQYWSQDDAQIGDSAEASDAFGSSLAAGDFDRNGGDDLAIGVPAEDGVGAVNVIYSLNPGYVLGVGKISDVPDSFLSDNDNFGWSVVTLGDLDGDGTRDLAVGAPLDDDGGTGSSSNRGAVWVQFLGGAATRQKISDTQGNFLGALTDDNGFGKSLAALGDLDGDGVEDLAVGAPNDHDGGIARGALWVLFLDTDGTVAAHQKVSDTQGLFAGTLGDYDRFGESVAVLGDLDGDGVRDLVVGASGDDDGGAAGGAVWVLSLHADGTVKEYQKVSSTQGGFTGVLADGDYFGSSVTALGDVNGDGLLDVAVGAPRDDDGGTDSYANRGAVWLLFLNADGTVKQHQKISDSQGSFSGGLEDGDGFGRSVTALGDLDGDGVQDLAVGAAGDNGIGTHRGAVWLLFLNADGTVKRHRKINDAEGGFYGALDNFDQFGRAVTPAGDFSADGIQDFWVGAPGDDDGIGAADRGAAWLLVLDGAPATCGNGVLDPVFEECDDAGFVGTGDGCSAACEITPVPEPGQLLSLLAGAAFLAVAQRRRSVGRVFF